MNYMSTKSSTRTAVCIFLQVQNSTICEVFASEGNLKNEIKRESEKKIKKPMKTKGYIVQGTLYRQH